MREEYTHIDDLLSELRKPNGDSEKALKTILKMEEAGLLKAKDAELWLKNYKANAGDDKKVLADAKKRFDLA